MKEQKDAKEFEFKEGKIEFSGIKFKHLSAATEKSKETEEDKENKQLFENFNLKIEPGTSNAIVGQSGFGKTTLFNLLLRIYDP